MVSHCDQILLNHIASHSIDDLSLRDAVDALLAKEDLTFWTDIIGDPTYSNLHRARCFCVLFERHVRWGMPIAQLLDLPHVLEWINISEEFHISGKVSGPAGRHDNDGKRFISVPPFVIRYSNGKAVQWMAVACFSTIKQPEDSEKYTESPHIHPEWPLNFLRRSHFCDVSVSSSLDTDEHTNEF